MAKEQYTIGFANLDEKNPFAISLREGLETAASRHRNISLLVRDNDLNFQRARANIEAFASVPVDLAMIYHIDEREGANLVGPLIRANIPVVSVIHQIPLTTYFGLDNRLAGQIVGEDLGQWIQAQWKGQIDRVLALTNPRLVQSALDRISAALEVLAAQVGLDSDHVLYVDDGGLPEITQERVYETLQSWTEFHHIVVIALGDHIAVAALEAARALGREEDIVVGGMDGIYVVVEEFRKPTSRLIYSLTFDPMRFGEQLLELAISILKGERVSRQQLMPPRRLTRDSF